MNHKSDLPVGGPAKKNRRKRSFVQGFVNFLVQKERKRVFENRTSKATRIVGEETNIIIKNPTQTNPQVRVEQINLSTSGEESQGYIFLDDASKKFGIPKKKLQKLCRDRELKKSKKKSGRWIINEDELKQFIK